MPDDLQHSKQLPEVSKYDQVALMPILAPGGGIIALDVRWDEGWVDAAGNFVKQNEGSYRYEGGEFAIIAPKVRNFCLWLVNDQRSKGNM